MATNSQNDFAQTVLVCFFVKKNESERSNRILIRLHISFFALIRKFCVADSFIFFARISFPAIVAREWWPGSGGPGVVAQD